MNSQDCKKKVADNIKLCMALLKQREKEMIEEIESRREENEHALVLQQVFLFAKSVFAVPSTLFKSAVTICRPSLDHLFTLFPTLF